MQSCFVLVALSLCALSLPATVHGLYGFEVECNVIDVHVDQIQDKPWVGVPAKGTVVVPQALNDNTVYMLDNFFANPPTQQWPWTKDWVLTLDEAVGSTARDLEFVTRALPLDQHPTQTCDAMKEIAEQIDSVASAAAGQASGADVTALLHVPPGGVRNPKTRFRIPMRLLRPAPPSWGPQITFSLPLMGAHGSPLWQFIKGLFPVDPRNNGPFHQAFADMFGRKGMAYAALIHAIEEQAGITAISDAEKAFVFIVATYWYHDLAELPCNGITYPKRIAHFILSRTSLATVYGALPHPVSTPAVLKQFVLDIGPLAVRVAGSPTRVGGCRPVGNRASCDKVNDGAALRPAANVGTNPFWHICDRHNSRLQTSYFAPTLDAFFGANGLAHVPPRDLLSDTGLAAIHNAPPHVYPPGGLLESMGKQQALDAGGMVRFEMRAVQGATSGQAVMNRLYSLYRHARDCLVADGNACTLQTIQFDPHNCP